MVATWIVTTGAALYVMGSVYSMALGAGLVFSFFLEPLIIPCFIDPFRIVPQIQTMGRSCLKAPEVFTRIIITLDIEFIEIVSI